MLREAFPAQHFASVPREEVNYFISLQVQNVDDIDNLQRQLHEEVDFMESPAKDAHLTLFHCANLMEFYWRISQAGAQVPFEIFNNRMRAISRILPQIDPAITVYADELAVFDVKKSPPFYPKSYLVIKLKESQAVKTLREPIMREICRSLEAWGIRDSVGYLKRNGFQHAVDFSAHITLGVVVPGSQPNLNINVKGFPIILKNSPRLSQGNTTLTLASVSQQLHRTS